MYLFNNYRPISILPAFSKILEKKYWPTNFSNIWNSTNNFMKSIIFLIYVNYLQNSTNMKPLFTDYATANTSSFEVLHCAVTLMQQLKHNKQVFRECQIL